MHEALAALMSAPLDAVMAVLAGALIGLFFYVGLWWTVRRAGTFRLPAVSLLASLLLRMAVTLGGFYLVSAGNLPRLLLCLGGFLLARGGVTRLVRVPSSASGQTPAAAGGRHAP